MKVLVTGASGFIGSHLAELLLGCGVEVWNISKPTYAVNPIFLRHLDCNKKYHYLPFDILQTDELRRLIDAEEIGQVYHLAAETHVDRSFTHPRDFILNNTVGTWSILEAIRNCKQPPKLFYMSTDEVFGNVESGFCLETDVFAPRNPYSASKAAAEHYCMVYHHSYGVPVVIGRSMNNYGPRQHPEKLISKIITNCLSNKPYTLYEGGSVRGWIYVKDCVRAVQLIMEKGIVGEAYHIPPNKYLSVPEINDVIVKLAGASCFGGFKGRRLKDDERYALNAEKTLNTLGFKSQYSFEEGLRETVEWTKTMIGKI